jgi:hypothetical protein
MRRISRFFPETQREAGLQLTVVDIFCHGFFIPICEICGRFFYGWKTPRFIVALPGEDTFANGHGWPRIGKKNPCLSA